MSLAVNQTLLHYRILEKIGEGGMGVVWKALDTRLGREVALKVLPSEMAGDAERLARFKREAQSIAALNHPNIVTLHSVEEVLPEAVQPAADGGASGGGEGKRETLHLLTMELVAGQSLGELMPLEGFDLETLLDFATQIAGALAAAHDKDIVHRDLKPANVMVTDDRRVKILDFGLAKLAERQEADEATQLLTQDGMLLGTVPYMSPEQVQTLPLDHRSDIFSFGVLIYEMATGERPFQGDNAASVISAVMKDVPVPLVERKAELPNQLGRIVRRCLEKRPERRAQSARDVQLELEDLQTELAAAPVVYSGAAATVLETAAPAPAAAPPEPAPRRGRASWSALAFAAAAAALLGALIGYSLGYSLNQAPPAPAPPQVRTLTVSGFDSQPSVSPDGSLVAFSSDRDGTSRIWLKQLSTGGEEPLTEGPDQQPRFSSDGTAVLFSRDDAGTLSIYRRPLVGGQARKLVDNATEADWSPDGSRLAFTRPDGDDSGGYQLLTSDAQGGNARTLFSVDTRLAHPRWSPDGSRLVALLGGRGSRGAQTLALALVDTQTGEHELVGGETQPRLSGATWVSDETLVYARHDLVTGDQGGSLARVVARSLSSDAERTLFWTENIFPNLGPRIDSTWIDRLGPQSLVFHRGFYRQTLSEVDLAPVDGARQGVPLTRIQGIDRQPLYSPDGRQILFASNRSGNLDLWRLDREGDGLRQLTDHPGQDYDPALSPDGARLVWSSSRTGQFEIWIADADGSGARQLTRGDADAQNPSMTPDGWVVFWRLDPAEGVWKIRPDGSDEAKVASGPYTGSKVSPDGRYVAYLEQESVLTTRILVSEIATAEPVPFEIRVTVPLGAYPVSYGRCRWMPDGKALAFVGTDRDGRTGIFVQDFEPGADTSSSRRPLAGFFPDLVTESFGLSPDGRSVTLSVLDFVAQLMRVDSLDLGGS